MSTIRKILIGLILGSLLLICHAWPVSGEIFIGSGSAQQLVSDDAGGAIMVWENPVFAQRIDHQGTILWSSTGISICTVSGNQLNPQLVSDGAGGAIIVWQDDRSDTTGQDENYDIYSQRVNSNGSTLWILNGVAICTAANNQINPTLVSDGSGGSIITWQDDRNGNFDIYAQRVSSTGSTLWTINGIGICTIGFSYNQENPKLVSDGSGGAIITWQGDTATFDIYAQRVSSKGSTLWTPNGVSICNASGDQINPQLISDASGGAIIVWQDNRSGTEHIYTQRVSSSGSTLWSLNGIAICTAVNGQFTPVLIPDELGGAIIAWEDDRNVNESNVEDEGSSVNVFGQHITSQGSTLWVPNGINLMGGYFTSPSIVSDGLGGAVVSALNWDYAIEIIDYWVPGNIAVSRVNNLGSQIWIDWMGNDNDNICSAPIAIMRDSYGGFITGFDVSYYYTGLYVQRMDINGNISSPELFASLPDVKLLQGTSATDIFNLNNYYSPETAFWSWSGNTVNIQINPDNTVDYLTTADVNYIGQEDVTYTAISYDTESTVSVTKYSSYLLSKLPRVIVKNGVVLENSSIDFSQYATPTTPFTWPVPQIQYTNANDTGTISATINSNFLTITATKFLQSPANVIITATPDSTSNDWDEEIVRVYEVLNDYGLFDSASDTSQWVYENIPTTSEEPTVSYLSTYNGATGILTLSFSSANQGVKMTLGKSNWLTSSTEQWYTIRMKVMSDTPNNMFAPMLFLYNGVPGNPFEVSVHVLVSVPTTWTWMETAVYCDFTASLYPQLLIRNGNSIGNVYIDTIEIIQANPGIELAYGNTRIANPYGAWDDSSDTAGWAFETPYGATLANYAVSGDYLNVSFDGTTTEGIKMTGTTAPHVTETSPVTFGKSAGMKMNLSTSGTMSYPFFLLSVFGTDSQGSQNFKELCASASVWYIPGSGQLETSYIPYQPYIYGQVQVRNSGNGVFYLNNTYLQADMDSPYYWDHSLFE